MTLHYDESRPSPLQRQQHQKWREARANLNSNVVKLRSVYVPPPLVHAVDYWPPVYWDVASEWNVFIPPLEGCALENSVAQLPERSYSIREIQQAVCRAAHLTWNDLLSSRRTQNIVNPRHIAMALCRRLTQCSMPEIGRNFNGKDHTTVLHAICKMQPIITEIEWAVSLQSLEYVVALALDLCWLHYPPAKYSRHGNRP